MAKYSDVLKITGVDEAERKEAYELLLHAMLKTSKRLIIAKIKEAMAIVSLEPSVEHLAALYEGCHNTKRREVLYKIVRYFASDLLKEQNYKMYFYTEN